MPLSQPKAVEGLSLSTILQPWLNQFLRSHSSLSSPPGSREKPKEGEARAAGSQQVQWRQPRSWMWCPFAPRVLVSVVFCDVAMFPPTWVSTLLPPSLFSGIWSPSASSPQGLCSISARGTYAGVLTARPLCSYWPWLFRDPGRVSTWI